VLLEHWDEDGVFHHRPWSAEDRPIKRSALRDRRNQCGRLAYTSLIVDAVKR
jgi:predicted SAM-dependent methyltransferase